MSFALTLGVPLVVAILLTAFTYKTAPDLFTKTTGPH